MKNWLKKLILGGSCSFPCIFAQCIQDIFKTFQFSCLKSLNHTSSCGKTQLGTDLPHHLRAQGPGTVELSSYPAEDTHQVIPISKGSKGQNKRVGQKHEKTKTWQKRGVEIDKTRMAAAVRLRPRRCRRASLLRSSQWPGHLLGQGLGRRHRALERPPHHWAPLGVCRPHGFGDLFIWHIDTETTQRRHSAMTQCDDTMCWHNVMTMLRSNPVLDAFVWVSAALATRLGKKTQNTRNHKHHAVNDGDSCDLCLLTLLSVQLNVCPMPWS